MGEALVIASGLLAIIVIVGLFFGVAVILASLVLAAFPGWNRKWVAFMASGVLPLGCLLLFVGSLVAVVDEEFRGPEVLGLAILGIATGFAIVVAWPFGWWLTDRFLRKRGVQP